MSELGKKILITGATGLVGSNVLRSLLKNGHHNLYITKRKNSKIDLIKDIIHDIHLFETDINDVVGINEAVNEVDMVIHLGAMVSFSPADKHLLYKVNSEGTANVVNACLDSNIEKLVHISSIAALGRSKKSELINENAKWINDNLNTHYAISKYLAEQEVWRGFQEGLSMAIVNPSLILGAGYWKNSSSSVFGLVGRGLPFFPPGINGFVDVRDVADMIVQLLFSKINGERIICNGGNYSYEVVFRKMAEAMNVRAPGKKMSPFIGALAWRLFWIYGKITGKKPGITKETISTAFNSFGYDNQKSIDLLDFKYRDISTTIEDTCNSYLQSKENKLDFGLMET